MIKEDLLNLFSQDIDFVSNYSKYHIEVAPDLDSVTDDMWFKIKDLDINSRDYGFFAIDNKDVIPWIVGFYVKPEYRKNNNLIVDMIVKTSGLFCVTVSNTNERAIKFLNKFCKQMEKDDMKTVFYYSKGSF